MSCGLPTTNDQLPLPAPSFPSPCLENLSAGVLFSTPAALSLAIHCYSHHLRPGGGILRTGQEDSEFFFLLLFLQVS